MIYCDAVTPEGKRLHFEEIISPGDVVHDDRGNHYVVGPDLGDEHPRLMPMDHDHYMAWWHTANPHIPRALTDQQNGGEQ